MISMIIYVEFLFNKCTKTLSHKLKAVGLNVQEAIDKLAEKQAQQTVMEQGLQWQQLDVSSISTVVFNRKNVFSGAHLLKL